MDWNFALPGICRDYQFVVFDVTGLQAPTRVKFDEENRAKSAAAFKDALSVAEYWRVPHIVLDDMMQKDDPAAMSLVGLLKKHTISFGRYGELSLLTKRFRSGSVEVANEYGVSEPDRVALMYALAYAEKNELRTALLTDAHRNINAFHQLRRDLQIDPDKAVAHKLNSKGVYAPVLEATRVT